MPELVKSINLLGQVEIDILEPVDKSNVGFIKSEVGRSFGNGKKKVSVILIREK